MSKLAGAFLFICLMSVLVFQKPISLNILRNDFMLDKNKKDLDVWLSNIEINTVSVSFGACTSKMSKLHKNLMYYTENPQFVQNVGLKCPII